MQRRRRYAEVWLPALALLLSACTQPDTSGFEPPPVLQGANYIEQGDLGSIEAHGQLRLLMVRRPDTVNGLPRAGSPVDSQLRAASRFVHSIGLDPVVVLVEQFDQLMPALRAGRGDLIVANLPIAADGDAGIGFTVALDRSRQMLVARSDDPIQRPEQLAGRSITVGFDSRYWPTAQRLQTEQAKLEVNSLPALSTARKLDLLEAGEIDLTIVDSNTLERELAYRDHLRSVFPVAPETGVGWGMRAEAGALKATLDRFITRRKLAEFDTQQSTGDLPVIERSRTLRVATRNSAANYFVWRGRLLGFEYELAKRFADSLDLRLKIVVADPEESLRQMVRSGRADMAAAFLHKRDRSAETGLAWSRPYHYAVQQVVSRSGDTVASLDALANREIHAHRGGAAWAAARQVQEDDGIPLQLVAMPPEETAQSAIRKVARGEYDLTLVDDQVAKNAAAWRDNVTAGVELGKRVAQRWAFRASNDQLRAAADRFLDKTYRSTFYNVIYAKYFRDGDRIREYHARRVTLGNARQLSPYDQLIQRYAEKHGFDWRLIAAQIYQESGFNPNAGSWAGARGLMQIMPDTAKQVGVDQSIDHPEANIRAGVGYLDWLRSQFDEGLRVQDRMWFTLAAFNAGLGHVRDARRLASRLDLDPDRWFDNVEHAMRKLASAKYYRQARFGYVRGSEPVQYVRAIRERYQAYILWTNDCWPNCQTSPHPTIAEYQPADRSTFGAR